MFKRKKKSLAEYSTGELILFRFRKNKLAKFGVFLLSVVSVAVLLAPVLSSYAAVTKMHISDRFTPPNATYVFGTDEFGRDLFARIIYGSRYSLAVGFGAVAFGFIIGVAIGAISGYYGGWTDIIIMRLTDIFSAIPGTLLCMVFVAMLGPGMKNLLISIGVSCVSGYIRLARATILSTRGEEYVESARAIGMSELRIIYTQVLPNSLSPLIVATSSRVATCILSAAGLSFLGFGVPVPLPEWGALISDGRNYLIKSPHLTTFPGIFIMVITFACALLDYTNTGIILNCMHGTGGCFLYIKEVEAGATDVQLGAEEKGALERALGYVSD